MLSAPLSTAALSIKTESPTEKPRAPSVVIDMSTPKIGKALSVAEQKIQKPTKTKCSCLYNKYKWIKTNIFFLYPEVSTKKKIVQTITSVITAHSIKVASKAFLSAILGVGSLAFYATEVIGYLLAGVFFLMTQSTIGKSFQDRPMFSERLEGQAQWLAMLTGVVKATNSVLQKMIDNPPASLDQKEALKSELNTAWRKIRRHSM